MEALYSNFFDYILHFDRYLPLVMEQYGHWIYANPLYDRFLQRPDLL